MSVEEAIRNTQERVETLPGSVWDCEGCDSQDSMKVRRSGLNGSAFADDIILKCMECYRIRTHGIPLSSEQEYLDEKELRGKRILDFANEDGPSDDVEENLKRLGYLSSD